jgi:hypothetical protein
MTYGGVFIKESMREDHEGLWDGWMPLRSPLAS